MKNKFDELAIPFWKLAGLKPTPKEVQFEKYLKRRGMSYGDFRREQDYLKGKHPSALADFEKHIKKYGKRNAPDLPLEKTS